MAHIGLWVRVSLKEAAISKISGSGHKQKKGALELSRVLRLRSGHGHGLRG